MGVVTRAKRRTLEEENRLADRISGLPDDVLGDIVSLLPTKDGARTQVLSSRWRHLWRSAPLNLDFLDNPAGIHASDISRILAAHHGPGRRFFLSDRYWMEHPTAATLDGWLRSPALDNLQELEFGNRFSVWPAHLLLPSVVHHFSSTLCVARFFGCSFNDDSPLQLPLLKQLSLFRVSISEGCLHAMLAGCPVLESLSLLCNMGFSRLQILSHSLKSIGVQPGFIPWLQLVIEDAPCLERLLCFGGPQMNISVISAPRLAFLGSTVFEGSTIVSMPEAVVSSVKVLALHDVKLCPDAVINLLQCFPHLQKLYIQIQRVSGKKWCKYRKLTSTLDIGLRTIVLGNYRGTNSHINLARFFVLNATVLEVLRFEIERANFNNKWIGRQHRLFQIKNSASRSAQFVFGLV